MGIDSVIKINHLFTFNIFGIGNIFKYLNKIVLMIMNSSIRWVSDHEMNCEELLSFFRLGPRRGALPRPIIRDLGMSSDTQIHSL